MEVADLHDPRADSHGQSCVVIARIICRVIELKVSKCDMLNENTRSMLFINMMYSLLFVVTREP